MQMNIYLECEKSSYYLYISKANKHIFQDSKENFY